MTRSRRRRGRALTALAVTASVAALSVAAPTAGYAAASGGGTGVPVPLSPTPSGAYQPATDMGSMYNITRLIKAQDSWAAGYTGKGIDIALIDSGVAPVKGLLSGNVVNGPDLSFDSQHPHLTHLDGYGHGTHMAGLIVGRDQAGTARSYSEPNAFTGVAPDARLVSVKVGSADGAVDVSQVIAAVTWVTQHANDPGFNIRVISLSYGTDSTQTSRVDPLAYAVEQAWKKGIVVVVAGGNDGTDKTVLANPASDPYVLAVGAGDPQNTFGYLDDTVPDFTSRGTNDRHVDLVAPGAHVAGLRAPGSFLDQTYPSAVVGERLFRGSGTSQAAAVTAGAAALLLQRYPNARPDQVKRQLMSSARSFASTTNVYRGNGLLDVRTAQTNKLNTSSQPGQFYGNGSGSLELARGSIHVNDGVADLVGEMDVQGAAWDPQSFASAAALGRSWTGGDWNGRSWTGGEWSSDGWFGRSWTGRSWTGRSWTGQSWTGRSWTGRSWTGSSWAGGRWQ